MSVGRNGQGGAGLSDLCAEVARSVANHVREIHLLYVKMHFTGVNFPHVQQFVYESSKPSIFPLDDFEHFLCVLCWSFSSLQSLNCHMNGCDGAPDLMGC